MRRQKVPRKRRGKGIEQEEEEEEEEKGVRRCCEEQISENKGLECCR